MILPPNNDITFQALSSCHTCKTQEQTRAHLRPKTKNVHILRLLAPGSGVQVRHGHGFVARAEQQVEARLEALHRLEFGVKPENSVAKPAPLLKVRAGKKLKS